jgi:LacI family transcriptional regulator
MRDIAERAGVSKNAVSLALRNDPQIGEATRERIQALAEEMGYERNPVIGEVMAQMRTRGAGGCRMMLALVNANGDGRAFERHPTIPKYVAGCERRAKALGYGLDRFWLHEEGMTGGSWLHMFEARGIQGVILVGLMKQNRVPGFFHPVLDRMACVVTGVRTRKPALSFACVDHHMLVLRAFEKALELGYARPGLVLDPVIDGLVERRFSAGFLTGQQHLPEGCRLAPFFQVSEARDDPVLFREWLRRERPDVIFTLYNDVRDWLGSAGLRVPEDVGLVQLEWRDGEPDWAGMNQHNDLAGEAAVDLLLNMIHHGERGVPPFPRATLIGATWTDGVTVRG